MSATAPAYRRRHARLACLASLLLFSLAMVPEMRTQAAPAKPSLLLEEECPEEFSLLGTVRGLGGAKSARVFLNYADDAHSLCLEVSGSRAVVVKRNGKASATLVTAAIALRGDALEFAVKRRLWRITLICNDQVVAQCYDNDLSGGRAGWQADPGVSVDLRLQATEPVAFGDDFTRAPGEAGQWEVLAGTCQVAEVAVGRHGGSVARYSSNAFSWTAVARPISMSATGYWFWDNYAVDVSAKPEDRGAIGVAAYLKDGDNFVLFRWTAAEEGRPDTGAREILRVAGGKAKVLATRPGGFEPKQWYRLRFVACEGVFTAYIDGELACQARDSSFGQGKAGLYARGSDRVTFDDVRVTATDTFSDAFTTDEPGKWSSSGLGWQTDARGKCRVSSGHGEGMTVSGRGDWNDYVFGADVAAGKAQAVGLVFAYKDPGEYALFRVPAGERGKAELLRVQGGKPAVIAESEGPLALPGRCRLRLGLHDGRAAAYVDDRLVVAGVAPSFREGRIGLYSRGGGARFSQLGSYYRLPEGDDPRIEKQFAQEATMAGWASAAGSWRADLSGSGVLWHTGVFYGSPAISLVLSSARRDLDAMLALDADGRSAETGYQAQLSLVPEGMSRLELTRRGKRVAISTGRWAPGAGARLRLFREGNLVAAVLGDMALAQYQDPQPLAGGRVGFRCSRVEADLSSVSATTTNLVDTTFGGPPTDWWAMRASWNVSQRWPCDDRWSFFGSPRSETPTLWTKQSVAGNVVAEAWVALLMDAPEDPACGYSHPSDLHLTFCGNGRDLSSGYTLQFAACNNTVTRLLRRDRIVAENRQVRMVNPVRVNLAFQRHWFHLRAEKEGSRIRCFVDDQPVCEYTDSDPLPGGQVALWTSRNGLMVARARVWYEKANRQSSFPVAAAVPAPAGSSPWSVTKASPVSVACDFERGLGGWAPEGGEEGPVLSLDESTRSRGKQSLRVVNRISGGSLGAACGVAQFDAVKFPVLQFDYRLDRQVRVNLYLRVHRQTMVIGVTAPDLSGRSLPSLGTVEGMAVDGRWHRARLDLLGALRRYYPSAASIPVEDLAFRSPDVEYLRSGFGGNTWGASYNLDDVRLVGAPETTLEDAKAVVMRVRAM